MPRSPVHSAAVLAAKRLPKQGFSTSTTGPGAQTGRTASTTRALYSSERWMALCKRSLASALHRSTPKLRSIRFWPNSSAAPKKQGCQALLESSTSERQARAAWIRTSVGVDAGSAWPNKCVTHLAPHRWLGRHHRRSSLARKRECRKPQCCLAPSKVSRDASRSRDALSGVRPVAHVLACY